jgi:hypothetical protein
MQIKEAIMGMAGNDPSFGQGINAIEAQLGATPIVPEDLDEAIKLLEFVLQNPDRYEEVVAAAIRDGIIDEGMVPPQFDQAFIVSLLIALYGLQERTSQKMARGGLTYAARRAMTGGQGGDTELVHVNRREAEMLRRMGGQGTTNPNTGLREYKSLKKVLGAVLPIAAAIFVPGLGAAIGGALGASGVGASIVGGAVIGGASSALTGGNVLQGALMGGLGGGLGGVVGGAANSALGLGLGETGQAILGSGLVGAGAGAATGQGVLKGALQGVAGGAIGELAGGAAGPTAFQQGVSSAGRTFGQALTAGYDPRTAVTAGALSGLATGITYKPSDAAVSSLRTGDQTGAGEPVEVRLPDGTTTTNVPGTQGVNAAGQSGTYHLNPQTGAVEFQVAPGTYKFNPQNNAVEWTAAEPTFWQRITGGGPLAGTNAPGTSSEGGALSMGTLGKVALAGAALSGLAAAPPEVQQAVSTLPPDQQEYFNRPSVAWDWNKLQNDANMNNLSLSQYMARNWNNITSGQYNMATTPTGMARGGYHMMPDGTMMRNSEHAMANGGSPLSAVARFARGAGSGRDDTINARLSDGEYVMDAETVAMLGDGSSEDGARKLDAMRSQLRKHKGKTLAKGEFSPNAKSPLTYLKGVA